MVPFRLFLALAAAAAGSPAVADGDYLGMLRPSAGALALPEPGFYSSLTAPRLSAGLTGGPGLKLGYRYSRFLSVETGFEGAGTGRGMAPDSPWVMPGRGRSAWIDTVGTLPLWKRASLVGRLGAYRAESLPAALAPIEGGRTANRLRYGLGLRLDLSRNLGLQADVERFSPGERAGYSDPEADQVSVGLTWRF